MEQAASVTTARPTPAFFGAPAVPWYLEKYYWWAYVRPWALRFWDHLWMVNLILYGNYTRLCNATLRAMGTPTGRTLQVACCYGNFTPKLAARLSLCGGVLDVIDVLPVQLERLRGKLREDAPVNLMLMDAAQLQLPDASYDRVVFFIFFHELPQDYRHRVIGEAMRVTKRGGTIIITDFAKPRRWHPIRLLWFPLLRRLKPFGPDVWTHELAELLPEMRVFTWEKRRYFGDLFQILIGKRTPLHEGF